MITPESAQVLSNNLTMARRVARKWDQDFAVKGAKIGQTINVRRPARYDVREGNVVNIQAQTETYSPLTFDTPYGIDLSFTSQELVMSFDDLASREIEPAMIRIANYVEGKVAALTNKFYNAVGAPGTALTKTNALDAVSDAVALLYNNDAPVGDMKLSEFNTPAFNKILALQGQTIFNPQKQIGEQYLKGLQGEYNGTYQFLNQLVPTHTNGTVAATGSATVTSTPTSPTDGNTMSGTLAVTVTSGQVPNVGDIFTIAGVNAVNPQNKGDLGYVQQITVLGVTVNSATSLTLTISPALVNSGPFQNVSALPAPSDPIVFLGAASSVARQSVIFHEDALMLANKELEIPKGSSVEFADYKVDPDTGIGVRYVRSWDVRTNQFIDRFDTFIATATLYEQLGARIIYA